jgi:hypothetical protein
MRPKDFRKDVHFHQFFYRINADKTIDAICGFCYMTAATPEELEVKGAGASLSACLRFGCGAAVSTWVFCPALDS